MQPKFELQDQEQFKISHLAILKNIKISSLNFIYYVLYFLYPMMESPQL